MFLFFLLTSFSKTKLHNYFEICCTLKTSLEYEIFPAFCSFLCLTFSAYNMKVLGSAMSHYWYLCLVEDKGDKDAIFSTENMLVHIIPMRKHVNIVQLCMTGKVSVNSCYYETLPSVTVQSWNYNLFFMTIYWLEAECFPHLSEYCYTFEFFSSVVYW